MDFSCCAGQPESREAIVKELARYDHNLEMLARMLGRDLGPRGRPRKARDTAQNE